MNDEIDGRVPGPRPLPWVMDERILNIFMSLPIETKVNIYEQIIQFEFAGEGPEPLVEQAHIVPLPQNTRDLPGAATSRGRGARTRGDPSRRNPFPPRAGD